MKIINGFMKQFSRNPRTLSLIDGRQFQSFKTIFDQKLESIAEGIKNGDQNLLASVIRARISAFDFTNIVGKTDTVDIGSLLKGLQCEGLDVADLPSRYDALFIKREFSQPGYTGIGAFFPDAHGDTSKAPKFSCYVQHMQGSGMDMDAWIKIVWATLTRGSGESLPACSCEEVGPAGDGDVISEIL
eukprot:gnl/MRDRNA2_/MRDRNA2_68803_c0_seq1.p1 gnl/MRDRNA2_/MRDRNA2_68803_c0~~gnl/MRDRNA2_/MRDRNA2_68803_c0_seq1.p1  ORF type:complete len:187 (+),score=39.15 gnl/MRDRNA2_/MRDRNA2_68803_c0_seq1:186-746(+)